MCGTGQGLSLFMDSVTREVGVKPTREETGGLHSFRFSQGWGFFKDASGSSVPSVLTCFVKRV